MTNFIEQTVAQWIEQARLEGELDFNPSARCRVCRDPLIMGLVNKMIVRSFSIPDMLDTLESHNLKLAREGKPRITKDCLYGHRSRHFDIQSPAGAILRRIQEQEAIKYGQDLVEGVGTILTTGAYFKTMMVKGYETLTDPDRVISVQDGAWAASKLEELERRNEDFADRAEMTVQYGRMIDAMRKFIPPEQWPDVQAILRGERPVGVIPNEAPRMIAIDDSPDPEET